MNIEMKTKTEEPECDSGSSLIFVFWCKVVYFALIFTTLL